MAEWEDLKPLWAKHVERQIYELGCLVRGQVPVVSARIADLVEQLEEVRKDLAAVKERQDKIADYVKTHVKKNGGAT